MKRAKSIRFGAIMLTLVMVLSMTVFAAPTLTGESSRTTQNLRNGVVYTQIRTPSTAAVYKTQSINVIEVDLSQRDLYVDTAFGNMNNMFSSSTVKNTMSSFKTNNPSKTPIAAVNGCPWIVSASTNSSQGTKSVKPWTMGFTYCNGEIYCTDGLEGRAAIGISEDFVPIYGMPTCEITLTQGSKVATADEINQQPLNDKMIVFTDRIMASTNNFVTDDAYEILIDFGFDYTLRHGTNITGTISAKYGPSDSGNPPKINSNQMVITARGASISELEQFTVGQSITVNVSIFDRCGDSARWQKAQNIQGGFFPLMLNGQVMNAYGTGLYPATIVGSNTDGKFVMITLDGRNNNGGCQGLYSAEMSNKLMTELGMYNALLLDGGGSATMVVNKNGTYTTVNTPEDNSSYNRPVYGSWIVSYGPQRAEQGDTSLDSLFAGFNADPKNVTFPDSYSISALKLYSSSTDYSYENDSLKLTCTGEDPYFGFNYAAIRQSISADEYKYVTLIYKQDANNTGSGMMDMFFYTNYATASTGRTMEASLASTKGKWVAQTFDLSSMMTWNGTVTSLRLDYFRDNNTGDTFYLHNIILSKTSSEASSLANSITGTLNAPDQTTFSFNMNGHGTQIPSQTLLRGQKATRPADPTADGYIFTGWYTSKFSSTQYDWDSVPVKNTTIVAKWQEDPTAVAADYQFTGWNWNGYSSATATFTDQNNSSNVQTVSAQITSSITTQETCTTAGSVTYTATVTFDGNTYTDTKVQTIPATGHDYDYDNAVVTAATCTAGGYTTYTCLNCGATVTADPTPALGHDFGAWGVITAATCGAAGTEGRVCSRCSASETRAIPATGNHTFVNGSCSVCGVADPDYVAPTTAGKFVISSARTGAGKQFSVTISLEDNPGIASMVITPSYNKNVLTLNSVTNGGLFSGFASGLNLVFDSDENVVGNGTLVTLNFTVADDAQPGDYQITLNTNTLDVSNEDLDEVEMTVVPGTVTVIAVEYGDVNGDGEITSKDVTSLRRYLANFDYDTNTSTVEVTAGADCNGDGDITSKDVTILRRYLANFDYDTGTSTIVLGPTN